MLYDTPVFRPMGDRALLVEIGEGISPPVNRRVREILLRLDADPLEGVMEVVPSYRSLLVVYNPLRISPARLQDIIMERGMVGGPSELPEPRTLRIPVVYGGAYGPDLEWVARYHGTTQEEVIRLHTEPLYQVYMIGFAPGFPYLGELPDALATPRRDTPRTAVPQGSVAIAQRQTGIYAIQSPGGWQVLGRTPLRLFDPAQWPPVPLEMGDQVKFFSIQEEEMSRWMQ